MKSIICLLALLLIIGCVPYDIPECENNTICEECPIISEPPYKLGLELQFNDTSDIDDFRYIFYLGFNIS